MITIDTSVDVSVEDIAEKLGSDCEEDSMLDALARVNARVATASGDGPEAAFAREASKRLHDLAKWFRENQP